MADHPGDLVLIDQPVGHRHGLFGLASIVTGHQDDFLAVDPTLGVYNLSRRLRPGHVLLAKCRVGAGHRPRYTDFHIGLNKRRNAQRGRYRESQKTFLVERLRHEVVLLSFFSWHCDFT